MTSEEMERAIEFLLEHHAKVTADIGTLTGKVLELTDTVIRSEIRAEEDRREMHQAILRIEEQAESNREEMRETINNMILANEVTRDLAQKVASLEVQTSQRVTGLEGRVTDIESKLP